MEIYKFFNLDIGLNSIWLFNKIEEIVKAKAASKVHKKDYLQILLDSRNEKFANSSTDAKTFQAQLSIAVKFSFFPYLVIDPIKVVKFLEGN
jgi:hypothetical protein